MTPKNSEGDRPDNVTIAGGTGADSRRSPSTTWSTLRASRARKEEVPRFAEQLGRMVCAWLEHLAEIRGEMGDTAAERLEKEARTVGPTLHRRPTFSQAATRRRNGTKWVRMSA